MTPTRSVVVVQLVNPREKYWGRLDALTVAGIWLVGMDLSMVEEWAREVAREEAPSLGLSNVFFPLSRIEKIYVDENVGSVPSIRQRFLQIVGEEVDEYLGIRRTRSRRVQ